MTDIERHSRWLLLAYPRWYRKERTDEILDTLLEVAGPDRSWPSSRDSSALILGGLRVRSGLLQRLTARANLTQALLLTAVLILAAYSSRDLGFVRGEWGYIFPSMLFAWVNLVLGLATLALMAGAWFGPPRVVAVAALLTAGLWIYQPPDNLLSEAIQPVAALAFIALLALRRQRLPRSWLWLAVVWYLTTQLVWLLPASRILRDLGNFGPLVILAAAIVWCAVDVRPMLAVALSLAVFYGSDVVGFFFSTISAPRFRPIELVSFWPWETIAAVSTVLVIVAIRRLRRQALL